MKTIYSLGETMNFKLWSGLVVLLFIFLPPSLFGSEQKMFDMDLASLMEIKITSAGRKEQNLSDVPAAVYVIDQEKLKKSGVTTLPEALRMVPGIQVARVSSNRWAISSRGFNGTFSNKLLVQIDGRSVYTPSYSGVYWDIQNIFLEDVERIEVIRGPGATLWGVNAVNGIINIITKAASETQGVVVNLGTGNHEKAMTSMRYGSKFNVNTYGRFYAMYNKRDDFDTPGIQDHDNREWENKQAGFRLDGDTGIHHTWTVQGDFYQGKNDQDIIDGLVSIPPFDDLSVSQPESKGGNLLGRWHYKSQESGTWTLQGYYDFTNRDELFLEQTHHTFDLDLQHRFQPGDRHDIVWGLGYRLIKDDFTNSVYVSLDPDEEIRHIFSGFFQDEIMLIQEKVWLTLGTKIEHNDYTDFEFQPNLRLLWKIAKNQSLWGSVSRAVRTPSRMETSSKIVQTVIPFPFYIEVSLNGNKDFDSEKLTAWEAGYRYAPTSSLSMDIALFYNRYTNLSGIGQTGFATVAFNNATKGHTYGMETSIQWSPTKWMDAELGYGYMSINLDGDDYSQNSTEGGSPTHQAFLGAGFNLCDNVRLNLWLRYMGQLKFPALDNPSETGNIIDSYVAFDANIQWKLSKNIDITLAGQNLLDGEHLEYSADGYLAVDEIERSLYAKLTWRF